MIVAELKKLLADLDDNSEIALGIPFEDDELDVYEIGAVDGVDDGEGGKMVLLIAATFEDDEDEESAED